ncbi:helix-turn-helix domain-containing protein [Nocardia sp. FBN12]|uniref:helix-turn-helix domain-containing protein n=1 Tax=Nocardia sp. FBN12 TaxID=3419766 RepID=UPI003D09543B
MVAIHEVDATAVPADQLAKLEQLVTELGPSELRELLRAVTTSVHSGVDVAMFRADDVLTPAQVATRIGMSRTHLYKLLDSGALPSFRVGRDRRVRVADVMAFQRARDRDRGELAERFAKIDGTRRDAIAELAAEL